MPLRVSKMLIPVCRHNVKAECIFLPNAWSAFGIRDLDGAD